MNRVLAVDLGGTKTAVGVVDADGKIIAKETAPTTLGSFQATINLVIRLSRAVIEKAGAVTALGVALPGIVDREKGLLLRSPSSGWVDAAFGPALSSALGMRSECDNDVNACALAEARFGSGRGLEAFFWLTISTGIGGALCVRDRVYSGARGMAGEIGHLVVREEGAACGCGNRGCLEAEAAGPAWRRKALALLETRSVSGAGSGFLGMLPRASIDARAIADGARSGDSLCREVVEDVGSALARGVASIMSVMDPEAIVVGGGVAAALDLLAPIIVRRVERHALGESCPILPSALGYDAALVGAAALALFPETNGGIPWNATSRPR